MFNELDSVFTPGLFNNAYNCPDYTVLNDKMISA
jgi:hypothetical protein